MTAPTPTLLVATNLRERGISPIGLVEVAPGTFVLPDGRSFVLLANGVVFDVPAPAPVSPNGNGTPERAAPDLPAPTTSTEQPPTTADGNGARSGAPSVARVSPPPRPTPAVIVEPEPDEQGWLPPVPFTETVLPSFPTNVFPRALQAMCNCVAEQTQTPPELAAMTLLGVASIGFAKKLVVEARPNWREPVNLYGCVVQEPGTRKSPVVQLLTKPLEEWQLTERQARHAEIAEAETRFKIAEARLATAVADAASAPEAEREAKEQLAIDLRAERDRLVPPAPPRLLTEDVTPEALIRLMHQNRGRIGVISAEGGLGDIILGRYSKGVPNIDVFLKAHRGEAIFQDRISREGYDVPDPALTLMFLVQRQVLQTLTASDVLRGRGLLARFLYSIPRDKLGYRNVDAAPVPASVRDAYDALVRKLLGLPFGPGGDAVVMLLEPQAEAALREFEKKLEEDFREGGTLEFYRDWAGKLAGAVVRAAGLLDGLAALERGTIPEAGRTISLHAMQHALALARYFIPHMQQAFYEMRNQDPILQRAIRVAGWIKRKQLSKVSPREVQRAHTHLFPRVEATLPVLGTLVEYGYLRCGPKGYDVNPYAHRD